MRFSAITCPVCGSEALLTNSAIGKARRKGLNLYCGRSCAGVARRKGLTPDQKRQNKADYDKQRRIDLCDRIKAEKAAYHKRTYDPIKAAEVRKARMSKHVEYCRRPEYRAKKAIYDQKRRDEQNYGDFAEAAAVIRSLETEVLSRASRYELALTNGLLNKATRRKREYEAAFSYQPQGSPVGNTERR